MIPSTTNQQSSSTSEQVLSSISGSSSSIMTSDGTKSSETALSIALGVTAFLFLCAIVIFYIILRRRISQRYETNVAHMNYSGAADNSFFVSRLSRQDLIPPDLNNGEVIPRESVHMDRTPRDGGISDQFNSRWSALGPRQQHPPLPDPYSRDSTHSESINMSRSARDSIADRSSSGFASGTPQQDPMTSDSNGESRGRESFYINREDSVYENDGEISNPGDHTYESIILNKIPGNQDQSTV
ncbi:uncharacterized protein LOC105440062 [Strongylocentrotus purpuratus]|uniref:Uncharacterized protein n=1 Tax=Strongylocentrotus purpuratus TaxID=7668 RepID=A0A7M7HMS6_STRPU|nr:uncharacterized protein LOC105440062 [Strongylocentrotus purpuratus]|eukprot:XP_011668106.1 PREDICTED: uncharacterized protein LOC105440062 [Strongylocentrotus purpuratus]